MSVLFVTASGTGVGKTLVTALLTRELRASGRRVRALKPIETGCTALSFRDSDAAQLMHAQGLADDEAHVGQVTGWRFAAPLSPDMAAVREHRELPFADLIAFSAPRPDVITLIEGVGGVMVPLDHEHTVLDWIAALAAPALLVTGSYLGTLSHTLTAVDALTTRGCSLAAVIVSESLQQPVPAAETADVLRRHIGGAPVTVLPRLAAEQKAGATRAPELLPLVERWL